MTINEIIKSYQDGNSMKGLSREIGISAYKIKKILVENGIKTRSKSEQTAIENTKRKKTVNENYFDSIDTVNKAWMLGFLAADGTVRKASNEIKIGLSSKDREIIEKIKEEIQIENKIIDTTTSNGFDVTEIHWTSKNHKEALSKYGIVNNKTYLPMHLPKFENEDLILAYILGFFDGDGSFSAAGNYCRMRFVAYRNELLQDIANYFSSRYNAHYSLCLDCRRAWELSISTTYAKIIFKDMYNLNSIHLERKFNKYSEWLKANCLE